MVNIKKIFPFLTWLPNLDRQGLSQDFIAGITVALVLIPQSMAYADLAGLPAYYGLYAAFLPGAVAALFGSSRQLATGPVAVVSLLTASALAPLAATGSEGYIALAIALSLMVGIVQITLGALRLGVVVNFLSHPVIVGFTNAAALIIGLSQLSKILGVKMGRSEHFVVDIWGVLQQVGKAHLPSVAFGIVAFAIMMTLKKKYPKLPNVLVAVSLTTLVSWLLDFQGMGGKVVGTIPQGLPSLAIPRINGDMFMTLLANAVIISLVGFMEAISIAKAMAARTKTSLDPNQELIGQGLANLAGSLSQAYPTSGSFSRSAVNINAGATSGASSLFTSLTVLITLLFLTPLLYNLPEAVLAAVIMMAVVGLVNFKAIIHAWRASRHDGIAAVATFIATLGFAPHLDDGILLGAGLSILFFLYRTMQPRVASLGRYEDGTLRDLAVHPHLPDDERIIVIRFDGQLYFANVAYFEDKLLASLETKPKAKYLLVVGDGINQLDASGEEVIRHLLERLQEHGMQLVFSGLKRQVLSVMRNTGLFDLLGGDTNIFSTDDIALTAIYQRIGDPGTPCPLMPVLKQKFQVA
ncbi:MAG: sulfate transporter [Magnetococcales bacterium]|nr:sulfate transporter [Magnetococcales bacterium]HIJ84250.1 sulfate permease [Magnetococcales bacterium]